MSRGTRTWLFAAAAVLAIVALVLMLMQSRGPQRAAPAPGATAPAPAAASPTPRMPPPIPEPPVPMNLPTAEPGLDQALARDYQRALVAQGIRVTALAITDRRASGGVRRADIVYRTATAGTLAALRPEVIRILSPGANPRLALDQITVRAFRPTGTLLGTITVAVADLDRWLKAQISDEEFTATWTVRGLSR